MVHIDLQELAARESERVEWKHQVASIEAIVQTAVAFSNDFSNLGGGYIVCGAEETKDKAGFQKVVFNGLTSSRLKEVEGKFLADCRENVPRGASMCIEVPRETSGRLDLALTGGKVTKHLFIVATIAPALLLALSLPHLV